MGWSWGHGLFALNVKSNPKKERAKDCSNCDTKNIQQLSSVQTSSNYFLFQFSKFYSSCLMHKAINYLLRRAHKKLKTNSRSLVFNIPILIFLGSSISYPCTHRKSDGRTESLAFPLGHRRFLNPPFDLGRPEERLRALLNLPDPQLSRNEFGFGRPCREHGFSEPMRKIC